MSEQLFVYGTLHPDRAPSEIAGVVRHLVPIGKGSIRARYHQFRDYPAIKLDPKARKKVTGNLFRIPDAAALKDLDEYEEYYPESPDRSLFRRKRVTVRLNDGSETDAWVYEYAKTFPARPRSAVNKRSTSVKARLRPIAA